MRKTDVLKTLIFWKLWYQLMKISLNFKTSCCNLKIESLMLFYYFNFSRNYEVLKSKSLSILFSLYKNRKLKVKLWWGGARERKKRAFFVTVYFVQKKFFWHLYFISMYSVLNTLSEYTYFYISKNITLYLFLLVFKIVESLQCILKRSDLFKFQLQQIMDKVLFLTFYQLL